MSAGATVTISDDENESDEPFLVVLNIYGKDPRYGVMVPKDDLSFKRIREKMNKDGIPVQTPFQFTLGAGGRPLSAEQEENWSDWGVFKEEGGGESYVSSSILRVFVKEGVSDKPFLVVLNIYGKDDAIVQVPKNDLSFKRIRDEIDEDEISVQKPFHFTMGAGGKPLSEEQEENWSDWSVFKEEGGGESYAFEDEYHVFIEEGKEGGKSSKMRECLSVLARADRQSY